MLETMPATVLPKPGRTGTDGSATGAPWLDLVPKTRALLAKGRFEDAVALTAAVDLDAAPAALAVLRARALIGTGRRRGVLTLVERFEKRRPAPAPLLDVAADAASASGEWSCALALLDRTIALSDEPRFLLRRGVALFNLDRLDECLDVLTIVARTPEFFVRAMTIVVRIHHRRRAGVELIAACEALLNNDPDNVFALDHLIRQNIVERDFDRARTWFEAAHVLDPDRFPTALFELQSLDREGRLEAAVRPFVTDPARDRLPEDIKERTGTLLYAMGRHTEAAAFAERLEDNGARRLLRAKIALATGEGAAQPLTLVAPHDREARLVEALRLYSRSRFDDCIAMLDTVPVKPSDEMAIKNFRAIASARRRLSHRLYQPARGVPEGATDLPIVQQLWVGSALSNVEKLSIRSFLACGHAVHLYAYDPSLDVPRGCELKDAREILPESDIFVHSEKTGRNRGSFAGFADLFRWRLLHEKGGAWADSDLICLRPIRSSKIVSTELVRVGTLVVPGVTNCFFAAGRGEPAFRRAFESSYAAEPSDLQWGEVGTHRMAALVQKERWRNRLTAPSDFCPIPPFRLIDAVAGEIDVAPIIDTTQCRAVHLYNEVMRDAGIDKNAPHRRRGLIAYLTRRIEEAERGSVH